MEDCILILSVFVGVLVVIPILILIIHHIVETRRSKKKTSYNDKKTLDNKETKPFKEKNCSYFPTPIDSGRYGEYKVYEVLKTYERQGCRFLFNVYLPKNNEETTEIDLLMISPKGIFVIESKNFSGYIFGDEKNPYWNQVKADELGGSVSNKFYNPIMQNNTHIRSLQEVLGYKYSVYSIVVFSEECILKDDIDLSSGNTHVVTINDLKETVEAFYKYMSSDMSDFDIETVYNLLYPYTQVSEKVKIKHIKNIQDKYQSENILNKTAAPHSDKKFIRQ